MPTALICEDDLALRRLMRMALATGGYSVIETEDAVEAIAALGSAAPIDVFLCDYRMPVSTGFEALHAARRLRPELPLVLVTGDETVAYGPTAASITGLRVLRKPFSVSMLLHAADAAVGVPSREIPGVVDRRRVNGRHRPPNT